MVRQQNRADIGCEPYAHVLLHLLRCVVTCLQTLRRLKSDDHAATNSGVVTAATRLLTDVVQKDPVAVALAAAVASDLLATAVQVAAALKGVAVVTAVQAATQRDERNMPAARTDPSSGTEVPLSRATSP